MTKENKGSKGRPEIRALDAVYGALEGLDPAVQLRVLRYAAEMVGLNLNTTGDEPGADDHGMNQKADIVVPLAPASASTEVASADEFEGINAVALKWMRRSGLNPTSLQTLFSLGVDEIDLVAKKVPGESKKEKMHNVLLLKGIAAYLGTGAARVTYEQVKEACIHYAAYDMANFASYLKSFAGEVSGTKEAGFTLTARGIAAATELIKKMLGANP